jgi:hypothetical protein
MNSLFYILEASKKTSISSDLFIWCLFSDSTLWNSQILFPCTYFRFGSAWGAQRGDCVTMTIDPQKSVIWILVLLTSRYFFLRLKKMSDVGPNHYGKHGGFDGGEWNCISITLVVSMKSTVISTLEDLNIRVSPRNTLIAYETATSPNNCECYVFCY